MGAPVSGRTFLWIDLAVWKKVGNDTCCDDCSSRLNNGNDLSLAELRVCQNPTLHFKQNILRSFKFDSWLRNKKGGQPAALICIQ